MGLSTGTTDVKPYTIDDHPKARRSIETTRSWAAILTCTFGALLSIQAGSTVFDGIVRAEILQARDKMRERRAAAHQAILDAQQAAAEKHASE